MIFDLELIKSISMGAEKEYQLGRFSGKFDLGNGKKSVRIVFPHSAIGEIEKIEIADATFVLPAKHGKTIVAYGDFKHYFKNLEKQINERDE